MKVTKKKTNIVTQINKTKKNKLQQKGQLFSNNHPETTVHGYGFDTPKHAKSTLDDLENRDITYQFQVVNTMCARAKEVFKRTKDVDKQKSISESIKLFEHWLTDYKEKKRGVHERLVYLKPGMIKKMEKLAEFYNVSRKARGLEKPVKSDEGFLTVYRRTRNVDHLRTMPVKASNPNGETWDKHRNNYIFRRLSMIYNAGPDYGFYYKKGPLKGLPTAMHVNLFMWAYTPDLRLLETYRFAMLIKKINTFIAKYKTIDNLEKILDEKHNKAMKGKK